MFLSFFVLHYPHRLCWADMCSVHLVVSKKKIRRGLFTCVTSRRQGKMFIARVGFSKVLLIILGIGWSPEVFDGPKEFQLGVWTLIIQKSTVLLTKMHFLKWCQNKWVAFPIKKNRAISERIIFFRKTSLIQGRVVLSPILEFWVSLEISREISWFLFFGALVFLVSFGLLFSLLIIS